tara:strand:- start:3383 stop:5758 length:2376 start_codon:yes stop_codon:yes gene_type:complete
MSRARTPERKSRAAFFKSNKLFHPVINNPQPGYYIFMNPTENFIDSQNRLRESIVNNICRNYNIQQIFINPQDEVKSQGNSNGDLIPARLSNWIHEASGDKIQGYGSDGYKYYEHNFGNNNKTTFILPPKKNANALWASVIKLLSFDNYLSYGYENDEDGNSDESGHVCNGTLSPGFFDNDSFNHHAFIILYFNNDIKVKKDKIQKFIKLLTYNKNEHSNNGDEAYENDSMAKQLTQMFGWEILFNKAEFNKQNYLPPNSDGEDPGNDIVEYLNASRSTNRQVDLYKKKLTTALNNADWNKFFGQLNLGSILCVKDSYDGGPSYDNNNKMHYLYIDTICSHPTAGKAKRRQPQQNLSDNYPTINNKAGNDIYNFVEQSPGMELVDMTNIIGYYCRGTSPLTHLYSATKLSSLIHVIKFYYQKFGFRFYSTSDKGITWKEYSEQDSIDKTTNTLPRLTSDGDGWASMKDYSDLFTKINKDPNTVPAFGDLHKDFSWRNQWSEDWERAVQKSSINTDELLERTEDRLERVGFDDQGFTMFLIYDRKFMEKYSEQYLNNNIPVYDKGSKQGQSRFSNPTIKILSDEYEIFKQSFENMNNNAVTVNLSDTNSPKRDTVCNAIGNCTVMGGGKRKRKKTRKRGGSSIHFSSLSDLKKKLNEYAETIKKTQRIEIKLASLDLNGDIIDEEMCTYTVNQKDNEEIELICNTKKRCLFPSMMGIGMNPYYIIRIKNPPKNSKYDNWIEYHPQEGGSRKRRKTRKRKRKKRTKKRALKKRHRRTRRRKKRRRRKKYSRKR